MVVSKTLDTFLSKNGLRAPEDINTNISWVHKMMNGVKQDSDESIRLVPIGDQRHISGYIIIRHNTKSIELSAKGKRSKEYKCEVIFTGLRQPTKKVNIDAYRVLYLFVKRFKVSTIDLCVDALLDMDICDNNKYMLRMMFEEYVKYGNDITLYKTSLYVNKPNSPKVDAEHFARILLYDKYAKELSMVNNSLDGKLRKWKRLEVTININAKLKEISLDDYIYDISNMASKCFGIYNWDSKYAQKQLLAMQYKRYQAKDVDNIKLTSRKKC